LKNKAENSHLSVLLQESIDFLDVSDNKTFVDATLGMGGHTEKILSSTRNTKVFGFDQDPAAIELAKRRLAEYGERFEAIHSNFSNLIPSLAEKGIESVDGVFADLGVSSLQLDDAERGFSFRFDAPLDMRMNPESGDETAAELIARLNEKEIANVIYELGEERFSRRIARRIVEARKSGEPVETTKQLAELVRRSVPRKKNQRVNPATKTFQALRIKINREL
jgi:16S rRNA (cytosine1402-N4)-methyltransferase